MCCHKPPRLSSKLYSRVRCEFSPNKGRSCFQEHVICPRPSARSTSATSSGSVSLSAASSPVVVGLVSSFCSSPGGSWRECVWRRFSVEARPIRLLLNRDCSRRLSRFTNHIRRLPLHGLSPPRSCLRLVLSFVRISFGILTP
jgi:hypothetical protein